PGGEVARGAQRDGLIARPGAVGQLPVPEQADVAPFGEEGHPAGADGVGEGLHLPAADLVRLVDEDHVSLVVGWMVPSSQSAIGTVTLKFQRCISSGVWCVAWQRRKRRITRLRAIGWSWGRWYERCSHS